MNAWPPPPMPTHRCTECGHWLAYTERHPYNPHHVIDVHQYWTLHPRANQIPSPKYMRVYEGGLTSNTVEPVWQTSHQA